MDSGTLSAKKPKRKIVAISMVKNEMDIIESFVRHTLGFADLLIIADHKSTDRTREILEALRTEGLPLLVGDVEEA
ncbi:MAG: glycosyltransferase family 2 protein [Selenomonas sp.]|nr:glycosyltransferase family 2 protein [Selenomonas sp.]